MRLLNSKFLEMSEFYHDDIPPYAILSHTWGKEEVTLQDMQRSDVQNQAGFSKIRSCCEQAKLDGIEWVWIDTCCIDKTSSTELSEAINSMYAWYQDSEVCYAFLGDVAALNPFFPEDEFKRARWFKRGWCLQELIAPRNIEFYAADWTEIGTKRSLHSHIERITGIPRALLLRKSCLADYTAAQKISWASKRQTTRQEDEAYCLLGIFKVSMPLLYGEGRRAFHRLQEEIMKRTEDYSLLLWTESYSSTWYVLGVLASSPKSFPKAGPYLSSGKHCNYRSVKSIFLDGAASEDISREFKQWNPLQMTTRGLHLHTFVRKVRPTGPTQNSTSLLLWTGCMYGQDYMCIMLQRDAKSGFLKYGRSIGTNNRIALVDSTDFKSFELSELYLNTDMRADFGLMQVSQRQDLEIVLATKCEENVSFIEAFPSITIYKTGSCTQGRRLYCLNVMRHERLSLKFIACQYRSGITTGHFTVNFGQEKGYPWCSLVVDSDMNSKPPSDAGIQTEIYENDDPEIQGSEKEHERDSLSPRDANIQMDICEDDGIETHDSETEYERGISDRATGQLPNGGVVYVAVKISNDPGPLGYLQDSRQRKPAYYTLYITLLAMGAGVKSISHA